MAKLGKLENKDQTLTKKRPIKRIIAIVVIVVLLLVFVLGGRIFSKNASRRAGNNMFSGQSVTVEKRNLTNSISETGTIEANDTVDEQSTLTNVKVTAVNVKVGDRVNQGDVLATLDVSSVADSLNTTQKSISAGEKANSISEQSAQRAVDYAKANQSAQSSQADSEVSSAQDALTSAQSTQTSVENQLAAAKAALQSAQADYTASNQTFAPIESDYNTKETAYQTAKAASDAAQVNVTALQTQIAATTDASTLATLNAQLATAQNDLGQKLQTTSTTQAAVNAVQSNYDTAKADHDAKASAYQSAQSNEAALEDQLAKAVAAVNTAQSQYDTTVTSRDNTNRTNQNTVATQEDNLKTAQINNSTSLDAKKDQEKQYQDQLAQGNVTAQISGVVTAVNITAGDNYTNGTMISIEDDSSYIVDTSVDDYDIGNLSLNMPVVIKTNGTGDTELDGVISYIAPKPEGSTTSSSTTSSTSSALTSATSSSSSGGVNYEVKVTVNTANDKLKLGMTAQLSIVLESKQNVLTVPYNAVTQTKTGEGTITVFDEKTKKTEKIKVNTGLETDYYVEVSGSQVKEGMKVIVPTSSTNASETVKRVGPLGGL